ncbi:GvpH protein [Halogeometricum borinquense DSM 11551]|uniref:GvpH protein n=2 Tax=Halogeometricum borinquense TaxID=60847 RepID=E4NUR5_HALBP|nr:gas vesicle protein GvpH [Halogeometricum borinquense]ADQ68785.1 GvpH protein [Halogeometricum borinquense DSM 11551]ELY25652.1 GvpH protein [Halogeometricum borinquense DSM 11551]RYJ08479.1 GvpH protein [Halogeometricum borinquense]
MSPNSNDAGDPSDKSPDKRPDSPSGLLEQLRAIVASLAEIESEEGGHRRGSGQIDQGSSQIDYDYEVSIGLGSDDRTAESPHRSASDHSRTGESNSQQGDTESVHVETRECSHNERIVIADLLGVTDSESDDDLDVTLDTDAPALVLSADGETVGRVALDHPDMTITDVELNNQILEIRLVRRNESTEGASE